MMGQWRVEVSPGASRLEDIFLHVIQVGDQTLERMDAAEPIRTADTAGVRLKVGERMGEVTFNTHGELGGRIQLSGGDKPMDRPLATAMTPQVSVLVTPN